MTAIHDLSALDLIELYRSKKLSPLEVVRHLIDHIAAWEPKIQALYAYDPEGALAAAKASGERWAKGAPIGPLDGVPGTIKENIATKGVPVPLGTAAVTLVPAAEDAPPAARLREAGAITLAKTTMPDYGMLSSGLSSFHKLSRNPWNTARNPGGSSAGAGAAGAAGYGPLHIGTDIGGSVRLPAGWCGLVGLKPSLGRIPIDPPFVGRAAGPMTRTVADNALMMSVLSAPDWRDGMSLPPQSFDWLDLDRDLRGLRIGLMLQAGAGLPIDPEVTEAVTAAARAFEAAGAVITPVEPILTPAGLAGLDAFWRCRAWGEIDPLSPETQGKILPFILAWAKAGRDISGVEAVRGFNQTMILRKAAATLFHGLDAVLSPTAPIPATFPADWAAPTNDPARAMDHIGFTVPWNMTEQPAVSINCGYSSEGLPIGLQIVGPRFDDLGVLRLAKAYEELRGPQKPWPLPA